MVANRRRRQAVDAFRATLEDVISCVTTESLVLMPSLRNPNTILASFRTPPRGHVPLMDDQGVHRFKISLEHAFTLNDASVIHTVAYAYHLYNTVDAEILLYHWHPSGIGARPEPHFHVNANLPPFSPRFPHMHLPSGRISIESFVRALIADFDVAPRRTNWDRMLMSYEQHFRSVRSWA